MKKYIHSLLVLALVSLAACTSTKTGEEAVIEDIGADGAAAAGAADGAAADGAGTSGLRRGNGLDLSALDDPDSPLSQRVIYFNLDSSVIADEYTAVVEAHARFLADNPDAKVTLEGHTDERGTREYNLALGERRARSVLDFLLLQGAAAGQLETISYGEERPADFGHDENAWGRNRRVEIVYSGR